MIEPKTRIMAARPRRSVLRLHGVELLHPAAAILVCRELGGQEGRDQVAREPRPDDLSADAHDVDVVVLDRLVRGVHVVADRRADPFHLVRGDRGTDARAMRLCQRSRTTEKSSLMAMH